MMNHRNRHRSNCDPVWISLFTVLHLWATIANGATIKREIIANVSSTSTSHSPEIAFDTKVPSNSTHSAISPNSTNASATLDEPASGVGLEKLKMIAGNATEALAKEFVFDLSRYTSPYGENAIKPDQGENVTDATVSAKELSNANEKDYEKMFEETDLTTPSSPEFDELHKMYRSDQVDVAADDDGHNMSDEESVAGTTENNYSANLVLSATEAKNNGSSEKNSSIYINNGEIETKNYDISTNELKKIEPNNATASEGGEKRAKYLRPTNQQRAAIISAEGHDVLPTEGSDMNLNIPNTAEVWALAGMKSVEHSKGKFNQVSNKTSESVVDANGVKTTSATKLLADWTEIMKNNEFSNSSVMSTGDLDEKTLTKRPEVVPEQSVGENKMISVLMTTLQPENVVKESSENAVNNDDIAKSEMTEKTMVDESLANSTIGDLEKSPGILKDDLVDKQEESFPTNTSEKSESIQLTTNNAIEKEITTQSVSTTMSESEDLTTTTTALYSDNNGNTDIITSDITDPMTTSSITTIDSGDTSTSSSTSTTETSAENSAEDLRTSTKADQMINEENYTTISSASPTVTEQFNINQSTTIADTTNNQPRTENFNETKNEVSTDKGIAAITVSEEDSTEQNDQLKSTSDTTISSNDLNEVKYLPYPTNRNLDNASDEPFFDTTANTGEHKLTTGTPALSVDDGQSPEDDGTDVNTIIAATVSVIVVIGVVILVGFLLVLRKRQKQLTYGQRCRPVGLDAYSLDNVSVYNSVRRKGNNLRLSKRSYGNSAFEDPGLRCNLLTILALDTFVKDKEKIYEEFKEIPLVTARVDEVPQGCEDKNRYANVVPLPETRVHLKQLNGDDKTEYINANFVKGPKDHVNYYIACQAPMDNTIIDFWRMIWEQSSRVIIMATDLTENGIEKCAEYLPPSSVLDCNRIFGDFHVTLKNREVKDKYAVSTIHVKNSATKTWREIMHFWYQWPESGMPTDESSVIAMLLEARTYLKASLPEQSEDVSSDDIEESTKINGDVGDKSKSLQRTTQGPLTVHCSPGTGRTGTLIACDIALRTLEAPARSVDLPQIVYHVRRGRASAIRTQDQYEFIYQVAHAYATKLTSPAPEN
ncbi:uncharacterized protein DMENIID0001_032090 [Sergentomyia squamirostris]